MKKRTCFWLIFLIFSTLHLSGAVTAFAADLVLPKPDRSLPILKPKLSPDSLTATNGVPPLMILADPNPERRNIRVAAPVAAQALRVRANNAASFSVTYVAAGDQDPWGQVCDEFPENARAAFEAAAAVWGNLLQTPVPVTIRACWADMDSEVILGYSGGAPSHRDFSGAPLANVWYEGSLANALAGTDLAPDEFDMHITYNSGFPWYFGIDGNPPDGEYDLVTVAAHEIAHGLNFSGSAYTASDNNLTYGIFGSGGFPNIYDTFIRSASGTPLTSYSSPSTELGGLLTSENLWFDGPNANTATGGEGIRIFAPSLWMGGSSYSHLDYNTFAGTANSMMVYAVGSGSANHSPGPVATALLKDLGWNIGTPASYSLSGTIKQGSVTGPRLAGAAVEIAGISTVTSGTGAFTISGIPAGTYTLTISKPGYVTRKISGYEVSESQSGLLFYLTLAPTYSISGTIRQSTGTYAPIAGATVSIAGKTTTTSRSGAFNIRGIPFGAYTLAVSRTGFTSRIIDFEMTRNERGVTLYLTPRVAGAIKTINHADSYSITALYATPTWYPYWGPNLIHRPIRAGGSFTVADLDPDSYDIFAVFSNGSTYIRWGVPVGAGVTVKVDAVPGAIDALRAQDAVDGTGLKRREGAK